MVKVTSKIILKEEKEFGYFDDLRSFVLKPLLDFE